MVDFSNCFNSDSDSSMLINWWPTYVILKNSNSKCRLWKWKVCNNMIYFMCKCRLINQRSNTVEKVVAIQTSFFFLLENSPKCPYPTIPTFKDLSSISTELEKRFSRWITAFLECLICLSDNSHISSQRELIIIHNNKCILVCTF